LYLLEATKTGQLMESLFQEKYPHVYVSACNAGYSQGELPARRWPTDNSDRLSCANPL